MAKKNTLQSPPSEQELIDRNLRDLLKLDAFIPSPTRSFKIGQVVRLGGFDKPWIADIHPSGKYYLVEWDYMQEKSRDPHKKGKNWWPWVTIFPSEGMTDKIFSNRGRRLDFYQQEISSLLGCAYRDLDFDPPFQRGLVWSLEQKRDLITSMFNNVDIGKFTINVVPFSKAVDGKYEQIIDGKQRLSSIKEFYEDRFTWNGLTFSQLQRIDQHFITSYPVSVARMEDATEAEILDQFIKLNTTGIPVSKEHLDAVRAQLEAIKHQ